MNSSDDRFFGLKYIGFCLSSLPPEESIIEFVDFVNFCKFQLCKINHKLMLDPIWELYNEEDILAEYYAHLFASSKEEKDRFEGNLKGMDDTLYDWFDEQIAKNKIELEAKSKNLEEVIEFDPNTMGD